MKTITIFHSASSDRVKTVFNGEQITHELGDDGVLFINNWQTDTERGYALFAKGEWAFVCQSQAKDGSPGS